MKSRRWSCVLAGALIALTSIEVLAKEHGHARGKDKEWREHRFSERDYKEIRRWRHEHRGHLPPGLAKKDRLPPGLERRLRVRATLPPDLRYHIRPCPEDLERRLPPPPPDCERAVIGAHIVLLNRRTFMVLDIFHFEL